MALDLTEYTTPLSLTPTLLRAVVAGRDNAWLDSRHAADVFTPRENVAHVLLTEAEDSWVTRTQRILDPATVTPASPYDGLSEEVLSTRPIPELFDEFESWRKQSLEELAKIGLTQEDMRKQRTREGFGTFSVEMLLSTWVAHDLYHVGQMFKSYSSLYVGKIGPYQQFLNLPQFN